MTLKEINAQLLITEFFKCTKFDGEHFFKRFSIPFKVFTTISMVDCMMTIFKCVNKATNLS